MLLKSSGSQHGATSKRKPRMCVHLAHAVIHLKKKVREPRACSCAGRPTLTMSTRSRQPIQPHTSHPKKQRAILTARRISELRAVYVPCLYCPRFKYSETLSSALMAVQITPHARCWPPAVTDTTTHSVFTGHRTPQLHRLLYSFPSLLPEQLTITNPCVFEKKKKRQCSFTGENWVHLGISWPLIPRMATIRSPSKSATMYIRNGHYI